MVDIADIADKIIEKYNIVKKVHITDEDLISGPAFRLLHERLEWFPDEYSLDNGVETKLPG